MGGRAFSRTSGTAPSIAVLGLVIGHHVVLQADGNLASLGSGSTAWVSPLLLGFFVTVAAFWLAATGRQVLRPT